MEKFIYTLIAIFSAIMRQWFFPNPFDYLNTLPIIKFGFFEFEFPPILLNMFFEPFLSSFTFLITGLYYEKGSNKILGALLYLLLYGVHIVFMCIVLHFDGSKLVVVISVFAYVLLHIMTVWIVSYIRRFINGY